MNKPKFTSGSWEVCGDGVNVFAPETDTSITDVVHPCSTPIEEQEANARLIASAPTLYKACENALSLLCDIGYENDTGTVDFKCAMETIGRLKNAIEEATK